jgi:hypothetical protein
LSFVHVEVCAAEHRVCRAVFCARFVVSVAAVCGAAAGCAVSATPAVSETAEQFGAALAHHDGAIACAMLTDEARSDTETFDRSCAAQLGSLPDPGTGRGVEIWGDTAQVRFTSDTVFLLRFPDGWRVGAAGCTSRGEAPYDCQVKG